MKANPHMAQAAERGADTGVARLHKTFDAADRELRAGYPRKKYEQVPHNQRSVSHWGQRKLMLSELEFLTMYHHSTPSDARTVVVYAGAAPGTHIEFLASLFPACSFFLVDPAPFKVKPVPGKMEVRNTFFTEETVSELREMREREGGRIEFLFVSDIRTADPKVLPKAAIETAVAQDMQLQMEWHLALAPRASMFKFRLPWAPGKTKYLQGRVMLPIWGRETTTECRLIAEGSEVVEYDNTEYEEQMFFNRVGRVEFFDHENAGVEGLDHCYDCAAEMFVVKQFLSKVRGVPDDQLASEALNFSSRSLNVACSPEGRTLRFKESFSQRQQWFAPQVYSYESRIRETFLPSLSRGSKSATTAAATTTPWEQQRQELLLRRERNFRKKRQRSEDTEKKR